VNAPAAEFARAVALFQAGRYAEAAPILRAVVAAAPGMDPAWNLLGGVLAASRDVAGAETAYQRAIALKPEAPEPHFNLGMAYDSAQRVQEAIACYRRALALRPAFAEARNNLGNALAATGDMDGAFAAYSAILEHDAAHADANTNLGLLLQERGDLAGAEARYMKALQQRPDHADALNNLGYLLEERGRRTEAMALYRRALEVNPGAARAAYNLGLAHLAEGDFERGWSLHEMRFATSPPVAIARALPMPVFAPRDFGAGHRLAIWPEQGVGDQLLFSTLSVELEARGQPFVMEVDRRLKAAFERAHPRWTLVTSDDSAAAFAPCDRHIAVGSLPRLLRPTRQSFARQPGALLAADTRRAAAFRRRAAPANERLVGISWRSFQPKTRGHVARKKSAPLEAFTRLSQAAAVRLLDLQYGDTAAERERFARGGGRLERFDGLDLFGDLDGVLAAIEACDLVVTTSNVTAHLAGALGKRTLLFYLGGHAPFHYWVPAEDGRCLWYPSVEIVTGARLDTWERALERIHELVTG
jgi:tetratricopeptide (TPR) repeat protein